MEKMKNAFADIKIKVEEGVLTSNIKGASPLGIILAIDALISFIENNENISYDNILSLVKRFRYMYDANDIIKKEVE